MINCIVVDDEKHAIDILLMHIGKVSELDLKLATQKPVEAFQFIQNHQIDLIYLDIQMPDLDGLKFLKLLKGKAEVILTTAFREHALTGFDHDVLDYLLKPILFERFLQASQKAINIIQLKKQKMSFMADSKGADFIFVKTGIRKKLVKIGFSEISYIEAKGNYVLFHMDSEKVMAWMSLKELTSLLPANSFLRVHYSYIVSLDRIKGLEGNTIKMDLAVIPVGPTYKSQVNRLIIHPLKTKK